MNKLKFILSLHDKLSFLSEEDLEERLAFYNEIIDDRMEEGLSEEEAVAQIGSVDQIVNQILEETPIKNLVKEKLKPKKRMKPWNIALLALGSPIWLSLLISAFAVLISLFAALWSVVISLWACFVSVAACAPAGILASIVFFSTGYPIAGSAMIAAGLVCAGLAIFLFLGCKAASKAAVLLSRQVTLGIKRCFIKKEEAK